MKLLCYIMPLIINISLLPFWFIEKSPGITAIFESILGIFIITIYLIVVSFKFINQITIIEFIKYLILMLVVIFLDTLINYLNWGIYTNNLLIPDSETIYLLKWQMIISSIINVIGWIVASLMKIKRG